MSHQRRKKDHKRHYAHTVAAKNLYTDWFAGNPPVTWDELPVHSQTRLIVLASRVVDDYHGIMRRGEGDNTPRKEGSEN